MKFFKIEIEIKNIDFVRNCIRQLLWPDFTFVKSFFSDSGGHKTGRFDGNLESHFSYEINTFSLMARM